MLDTNTWQEFLCQALALCQLSFPPPPKCHWKCLFLQSVYLHCTIYLHPMDSSSEARWRAHWLRDIRDAISSPSSQLTGMLPYFRAVEAGADKPMTDAATALCQLHAASRRLDPLPAVAARPNPFATRTNARGVKGAKAHGLAPTPALLARTPRSTPVNAPPKKLWRPTPIETAALDLPPHRSGRRPAAPPTMAMSPTTSPMTSPASATTSPMTMSSTTSAVMRLPPMMRARQSVRAMRPSSCPRIPPPIVPGSPSAFASTPAMRAPQIARRRRPGLADWILGLEDDPTPNVSFFATATSSRWAATP